MLRNQKPSLPWYCQHTGDAPHPTQGWLQERVGQQIHYYDKYFL